MEFPLNFGRKWVDLESAQYTGPNPGALPVTIGIYNKSTVQWIEAGDDEMLEEDEEWPGESICSHDHDDSGWCSNCEEKQDEELEVEGYFYRITLEPVTGIWAGSTAMREELLSNAYPWEMVMAGFFKATPITVLELDELSLDNLIDHTPSTGAGAKNIDDVKVLRLVVHGAATFDEHIVKVCQHFSGLQHLYIKNLSHNSSELSAPGDLPYIYHPDKSELSHKWKEIEGELNLPKDHRPALESYKPPFITVGTKEQWARVVYDDSTEPLTP